MIRTNKTSLSDSQLILLDALFELGAPIAMLRQEIFCRAFNFRASHGMDNEMLRETLEEMVTNGLLNRYESPRGLGVSLSADGAQLWQAERNPKWDRYVVEQASRIRDDDSSMLTVLSPGQDTRDCYCNEFLSLFASQHKTFRVKYYTLRRVDLMPWMHISPWYVMVAHRVPDFPKLSLKADFLKRHSWWSSVEQLNALNLAHE